MVKQWVQPPRTKNRLPPGGFLLGSHLTSFIFFNYGILGESFRGSFEIQFLAIFQIKDLIIFEIKVVHWNIRGTLIQNTPNNENRSPCLPFFGGCFSNRE